MSAREIRAGRAFVEVTIRDKLAAGLARAQGKLRAFALSVKATSAALKAGFMAVGRGMTFVGGTIAAAGASILTIMGKAVATFLSVSAAAKKAGIAIGGIDAGKAEKLQAAWDGLKASITAVLFRIGEALAGPLTMLAEILSGVAIRVANFVKENQGLVVAIAAAAAVAVVAGGAIAAMGFAFLTCAAAIAGVASILTAILTPAGAAVAIFTVLAASVLLAGVAFLALSQTARVAMAGITAALAGGNLINASIMAATAIQIAWVSAWEAIRSAVFGVLKAIVDKTAEVLFTISGALLAGEAGHLAATGQPLNLGGRAIGGAAASIRDVGAGLGSADSGAAAQAERELKALQFLLNNLSKQAQEELMKKLGITSKVNFGNFLQGVQGVGSSGFGVAGSTSAAAAGFLRAGSVQKVEDKKAHEGLDDVKRAVEAIELSATAEFG